jgi:outer membrane receptor protein involved in Fe transport
MGVKTAYQTSTGGLYVSAFLPAGSYTVTTVTAEKTGFKKQVFGPVILMVNQTVRADLKLQVGAVSETVVVHAGEEQLLTPDSGTLSQVIPETAVSQLPLNERDWQQLIAISPGVTPAPEGDTGDTQGFNINGQRSKANLYFIDGVNANNGLGSRNSIVVPIDAIQEFSVLENSFSAQYGNTAGGIINIKVKSGTNKLHGSLFEYFRNDVLDANNYFTNQAGQPRAKLEFNQYGGSIGGPIKKNKTFFFGDYQGSRQIAGQTFFTTVPTAAERTGNFTASGEPTIYDPTTGFPNPAQFSYNGTPNVIPPDEINPVAKNVLAALPLPNQFVSGTQTPLPSNNLATIFNGTSNVDNFDIRVDQSFSEKSLLFVRYSFQDNTGFAPADFGSPLGGSEIFAGTNDSRTQNAVVGHTYVINSSLTNEFLAGLNRVYEESHPIGYNQNLSTQFGIPGVNVNPDTSGLTSMEVLGYFQVGSSLADPIRQSDTNFPLSDQLSWQVGRQSISFGFDYLRDYGNFYAERVPRGLDIFQAITTVNFLHSFLGLPGGGSAVASFLTGIPVAVAQDKFVCTGEIRYPQYGLYLQDDIKLTPRLTVNAGIRYDLQPPYTEKHNEMDNFDPTTNQMIVAGAAGKEGRLWNTNYRDISPRLGLAYLLTGDGKTVLRMGYGNSYQNSFDSPSAGLNALTYNVPFYFLSTTINFPANQQIISNPFPTIVIPGANAPAGGVTYQPLNTPDSYSQSWNVGIERAITTTMMADVSYTGTKGSNLIWPINIDGAGLGPATTTVARRPFPAPLTAVTEYSPSGQSIYNGLQAKLEKRFSNGLYFLLGYTFSRAIDNDSNGLDLISGIGGTGPQAPANLAAERGLSSFQVKHRFVGSAVWNIPYGRGQKFGSNAPAPLNFILGGWQITGIETAQSGQPFTVQISCTDIGADGGGGSCRPDQIGGPRSGVSQNISHWFNTTAFVIPGNSGTALAYGDTGRNSITGPNLINTDISFSKVFPVTATLRGELQGSMFDLFNRPDFGLRTSKPFAGLSWFWADYKHSWKSATDPVWLKVRVLKLSA